MEENDDATGKSIEKSIDPESEITPDRQSIRIQPANSIPSPETDYMEIHANHLHHAPGKKIWHYFFEFLMLFLAVFSGFLAENWREQLQEHHREKEFIYSIIEDLKSDTFQSSQILLQLNRTNKGIDSVLMALKSPETIKNSNKVYLLWTKYLGLETFVSNDRTIQQLKNSGELRLIRNKQVSDKIMDYDQTLKKYYVQSNLMYSALRDLTNYSQVFDFINLDRNIDQPVPFTEQGIKLLNQTFANLTLWNRGLIGLITWLEAVNKQGVLLIKFIQKEYQVK